MAKHYVLREMPLSIAMRYAMMLLVMIALCASIVVRIAMALFGRSAGC